jgi:alpha 1,2-mannosyltransferase
MGTVPTLWDTIRKFKRDHPEVTNNLPAKKDTLFSFITDDNGNSYNGCHFWTNFEVR